jgi:hypothetical protein
MTNLLPLEYIRKNRQQEFARFSIMNAFVFALIVCVGIISLTPSFILVLFQKNDLHAQEEVLQKSIDLHKETENEKMLALFGDRLAVLEAQKDQSIPSVYIENIGSARLDSIRIDTFSYTHGENETMLTSGTAGTRADLLAFVEALQRSGVFSEVILPVESLAKNNNVPFSIHLVGINEES